MSSAKTRGKTRESAAAEWSLTPAGPSPTLSSFATAKSKCSRTLSTPRQPEDAILKGIARLGESAIQEIIHGSTVATNALLERRKGAHGTDHDTAASKMSLPSAARSRSELYNIFVTRPEPLVSDAMRFGALERTLYDGKIETPLSYCASAESDSTADREQGGIDRRFPPVLFANREHEDAIFRLSSRLAFRSRCHRRFFRNIANTNAHRRPSSMPISRR